MCLWLQVMVAASLQQSHPYSSFSVARISSTMVCHSGTVSPVPGAVDILLFNLLLTATVSHLREWGKVNSGRMWGGSQAPCLCFLLGSEGFHSSLFGLCPGVSALNAVLYADLSDRNAQGYRRCTYCFTQSFPLLGPK